MDAILHIGALIRGAKEPGMVGFVLSEQQRHLTLAIEVIVVERFLEQGSVWCAWITRCPHLDRLQDRLLRLHGQDQVLRNHKVGSTCSRAASGPRLWMLIRISTSSGAALAYSTTTSKWRSSSKMPGRGAVLELARDRWRFVAARSS